MKNTFIILLIIALVIVGGIVYFYRDALFSASKNTSNTAGGAIEKVQGDVKDGIQDVKDTLE